MAVISKLFLRESYFYLILFGWGAGQSFSVVLQTGEDVPPLYIFLIRVSSIMNVLKINLLIAIVHLSTSVLE